MTNEDPRYQNALWWIGSIAVSVVCCSALFVLFANYLVDIKTGLRDVNVRINVIEERENMILSNIDMLRKHMLAVQPIAPKAAQAPAAAPAPTMDSGIPVEGVGVSGPQETNLIQVAPAEGAQAPAAPAAAAPASAAPAPAAAAPKAPAHEPPAKK